MSALFVFKTPPITSSDLAFLHIHPLISNQVEEVWVTCLTSNKRIIKSERIFKGSVDKCMIHPREIFHCATRNLASSFLLFHSHPSGETAPSKEDIKITLQIKKASRFMKINMIDHIIITKTGYYSFLDSETIF